MKRVQALFFLIILLSSFNVSAVNKNSYFTWKQKVIERGRAELIRLQRINAQNDRKGQSDKNSYLVIVSGEGYPNTDFIQQRKGIGRGASGDVKYLLDEVMLNSLDGSLRLMNSQSEVDSYLLIVHFMPLEFVDVIPDNQSIANFFRGKKNDLVDQVSEPIRDEARDIVTKITSAKLQTLSKPTLYCGFVNFQVFKNNKEGISQWVYYPHNGNIEFDLQYVNLLNGFVRNEKFPKDDISKIVTLVDLIKQNNDEYKRIKGTLASLYQITDPEKMRDEIRSVGNIGLAAFDLKQRIHALKVLTSARLDNGKEIQALNLLKTAPKRDYEGLLDSLVRVNQFSKSKESLLTCLVGRTDDEILLWGDDNYLELIRTITQLVFLSPVKETALDALVRDSGSRIYTWDKSYTLKILTTPPVGTNRYSVDLLDNGKVKVNRDYVRQWDCETYYQAKTDKPYEACDAIWETEPEQELDPFELVGFINRSDLSILNGVGEPDAKMIVVPALMLKYAQDKKINGDMAVGFFMSLDALTIAVPVTKVYNLAKIAQRIYLGLDLAAAAGSTANLIVNIQQVNPAFEAVVNKYNLVTGIINIAALAGGTKLAANVAGDFVNEVNKPGIKNSLIELAEQGNPEANKILLLERELVEEGKVAKVEWVDDIVEGGGSWLIKIDDLGLEALKREVDLLDDVSRVRFLKDFENVSDETLRLLNSEPDLLDVWRRVIYLRTEARDIEFLRALKKVETDNVWKHIVGETYSPTSAAGGHILTNIRKVNIGGEYWIYSDKIRFKVSNITVPDPWEEGMEIMKAERIQIFNGVQWVNKNSIGRSSFFPTKWGKQKILEETALAYMKAKANPSRYFDAVANKNAYNIISSDGLVEIRIFYGNYQEINPLLNGSANPVIKSSFPNN